jgi:hypothetical protein
MTQVTSLSHLRLILVIIPQPQKVPFSTGYRL